MKKLAIFLSIVIAACGEPTIHHAPFYGYVVCKEYTPGHMSDKYEPTASEAGILLFPSIHPSIHPTFPHPGYVPPHSHSHPRATYWVWPTYTLYVGCKDFVSIVHTDSIEYSTVHLGQRVHVTGDYVVDATL